MTPKHTDEENEQNKTTTFVPTVDLLPSPSEVKLFVYACKVYKCKITMVRVLRKRGSVLQILRPYSFSSLVGSSILQL